MQLLLAIQASHSANRHDSNRGGAGYDRLRGKIEHEDHYLKLVACQRDGRSADQLREQ